MMIIMGVLVYYPIMATLSFSFKKWKLTAPGDIHFVGLKNYRAILKSPSFWYSLENTIYLLVLVTALTVVLGFLVALFLNVESRGAGLLMAIAILPWALPPFVNGILWKFVFSSGYGFLNKLLLFVGAIDAPKEWLGARWSLLNVTALVVVWRSIPFMAIVSLAGLRSIPGDVFEAVRIDGGSRWQAFRFVTLPLMLPFITIGVTSTSVTALNVFDEIVALSGYSDLGKNLLVESYLTTFSFLDFGRGSALTYLVMLIGAFLGAFYLKSLNREVSY